MTSEREYTAEPAPSRGLEPLAENLELLARGDVFTPLVCIDREDAGAPAAQAVRRIVTAAGCRWIRIAADGAFPNPSPEEDLTEKLLAGAVRRNGALAQVRRMLRSDGSLSALENDQAVIIHRKEEAQHRERLLSALALLSQDEPCVVAVDARAPVEGSLRELLLFLARRIHHRLTAFVKDEPWPRAAIVVLGVLSPESTEPFVRGLRAQGCAAPGTTFAFGALPQEHRRILSLLALHPRLLALGRLKELAGLGRRRFAAAVDELDRQGLITRYGDKAEPAAADIRDAALAALRDEEKRDLARALAASGTDDPADGMLRAWHLLQAGDHEEGLAAAMTAIDGLRAQGALGRAEGLLTLLCDHFAGAIPDAQLLGLRRDLAALISVRGEHARARELLARNCAWYLERGDMHGAARVKVQLGILAANLEQPDDALRELEEAAKVLSRAPEDAAEYLRLELARARVLLEKSAHEQALAVARSAVEFLQAHDDGSAPWRRLAALTYNRLGSAYAAVSDFRAALAAYERSERAFRESPDSLEKGGFYCNLARLYTTLTDYRRAERHFRRAARIARTLGARELLGLTQVNRGLLALYTWDLAKAEDLITDGIALSEAAGSVRFARFGRICLGNVRYRQGRHEEALRIFEAEHAQAAAANDRYFLMNISLQSVYPRIELGEWDEALCAARDGARLAETLALPYGILEGTLTQGQACAALGDFDEAEKHLCRAREAPWGHHGHVDAELEHLHGRILAARGRCADAVHAFSAAAAAFRRHGVSVYAARSTLAAAESLARAGKIGRARTLLERVWKTCAAAPSEKRSPFVWLPAAILAADIAIAEARRGARPVGEKVAYATAEALACARETRALPCLWQLLALLGVLCKERGEETQATKHIAEARATYQALLARVPPALRRSVAASFDAARVALLGGDAEPAPSATAAAAPEPAVLEARADMPARNEFHGLIGASPAMLAVYALIERIAPTDLSVLIRGETGTGKELVARALHRLSARAEMPFVSENCAAIPASLAEDELFGHARGAFTGADEDRQGRVEAATGGTLFLDELGDLPLQLQAVLLRVLAEGSVRPLGACDSRKVDVRLLAATSRDLRTEIERGAFRADLFYRILGVEIRLPPLRERGNDVLLLAEHFLKAGRGAGAAPPRFTAKAREALLAYSWPGNVRELENEMRRLAVLGPQTIDAANLRIGAERRRQILPSGMVQRFSLAETQALVEREYLEQALEACGGQVARVAKLLGLNRRSVYKMMQRLHVEGLLPSPPPPGRNARARA